MFARKATDEAADVDPEDAEANGAIPTYSNHNLIVTNSGIPIYQSIHLSPKQIHLNFLLLQHFKFLLQMDFYKWLRIPHIFGWFVSSPLVIQARNRPFYDLVRGSMAEPAAAFVAAGDANATEAFERWLRQFHSERDPGFGAGSKRGRPWKNLENPSFFRGFL